VTFGDKVVQLNDQEKAMFGKMVYGLFDRLDAGDNDTHDKVVGGKDIDRAIKDKSWYLHGDETSPDGHWKDPSASISMKPEQIKEHLVNFLQGDNPSLRPSDSALPRNKLDFLISHQRHAGTQDQFINDPALVQSLMLLKKNFNNVDSDKDGGISVDEIKNWKI